MWYTVGGILAVTNGAIIRSRTILIDNFMCQICQCKITILVYCFSFEIVVLINIIATISRWDMHMPLGNLDFFLNYFLLDIAYFKLKYCVKEVVMGAQYWSSTSCIMNTLIKTSRTLWIWTLTFFMKLYDRHFMRIFMYPHQLNKDLCHGRLHLKQDIFV